MTVDEAIAMTLNEINEEAEDDFRDEIEAAISTILQAKKGITELEELIIKTKITLKNTTHTKMTREYLDI